MTGKIIRLFFAADAHGSNIVWRKWLSVPKMYDIHIMLLAGDLTGKAILPIVKQEDGSYSCKLFGEKKILKDENSLEKIKTIAGDSGYYPVVLTSSEVEELREDPQKLSSLFGTVIKKRMEEWLVLLENTISPDIEVVVMPGNDDDFIIDEIIKNHERVIYPLNKAVEFNNLPGYKMISLDYVNPTPWNTFRECSEKDLKKKLNKLADIIDAEWKRVICNFHPPPYDTNIDLAPKLSKDLKPVSSFISPVIKEHVGSKAVRNFIEDKQPFLGLHGHIHEARGYDYIGNTIVFNPGSEYSQGILSGLILEIQDFRIKKWWWVSG